MHLHRLIKTNGVIAVLLVIAVLITTIPAEAQGSPMTLTGATASKTVIQLTFDSTVIKSSIPPKTAFTIKVNGTITPVKRVSHTQEEVTIVLFVEPTTLFRPADVITISYSKPPSNPIQNHVGTEAEEFTDFTVDNLIPNTKPTAPRNIEADDGGNATSYDVTWDSAWHNGSPITRYEIRVDDGTWTTVTGGDNARSHTVTGLTIGTQYRIQVRAVNDLGNGPEVSIFVPEVPVTFAMYGLNHSITRGSNVIGDRQAPFYLNASAAVSTNATFNLTWNGRPTNELHPDNPTTVTINSGQSNARFYLKAAADDDDPKVYNQPVKANVVATLGSRTLSDQLVVFDDESLPSLSLSAPATVDEGDNFRVTATLEHRLDVGTTIPVVMHNPSNMSVTGSYGSISIPAGSISGQTGNLRKREDSDKDGWGILRFGINGSSAYQWWPSSNDASVRVNDDDATDPDKRRYAGWPRLLMGDAWTDESGDPNTISKLTFGVTIDPTSRSTITVDYRTEDGSAKAGVNYRAKSGTLTFAPLEQDKTVEIDVLDDGVGGHTTFRFVATGPRGGGAEVSTQWVTGRIYDETPTFRSWNESARESGNGSDREMNFYVSLLDFNKHGTYTVDYATSDGTARAGSDYTAVSGTLTFAPGEGYKQVTVPILDDSIEDSGETFRFVLSNPTGGSQLNRWYYDVKGTILNEDAPGVSASFPTSTHTSGSHTGTDDRPKVVVTFSEAVASFNKNTPSVKVANATITSVQSHTESGIENAYIFTLDPDGNDDVTFVLKSNEDCDSGGICTSAGIKLIETPTMLTIPGPKPPTVASQLSVSDATASEEDDSTIDFVVTLNPASDESVSVDYATSNGSATAGGDYTANNGTLTFNAGDTTKTVQVSIIDDTVDDNNETLTLTLSNPSGAEISDATATGKITNSEPPPLTARFTSMPDTHDGSADISFLVEFTEDVSISKNDFRDFTFTVGNGDVTGAKRLNHRSDLWTITVGPDSSEDVDITLSGNRDCDTLGAICTPGANPRQLSNSPSATVAGPAEDTSSDTTSDPLTATLSNVPDSHDGSTEFTFDLTFSENVNAGYGRIRDDAFTIDGGDINQAQRKEQGSNQTWTITVEPEGNGAISITLPETTDCDADGAICTAGGKKLSAGIQVTVPGPEQQGQEPQNSPATGAPTIDGTAQVGETLTASTSDIADQDGLTNVSYRYQWTAGGSDISGATGSSHTLTSSEEGQTIKVRVTFTDDAGNDESLTSVATVAVAAAPNREATGLPTISGTPQVDQTLTADTANIADQDGLDDVSYSYQWLAAGSDIDGATGSSHTLTASQQGQTVQVRVSFTDDRNNAETLTSEATDAVAAKPVPLTASFGNVPDSHTGGEFTFDLSFSDNFPFSYRTLRDHAFTIDGGDVTRAQRKVPGSNRTWTITVEPNGNGAVSITLPATTDCDADGAICTFDGRKLSNSNSVSISGPT